MRKYCKYALFEALGMLLMPKLLLIVWFLGQKLTNHSKTLFRFLRQKESNNANTQKDTHKPLEQASI